MYVSERTNKAFCYNAETRASQWTDPVKEPEAPLVMQPHQRAAAERVTGVVEFVLQSFDKDKGTGVVMSTPFQAGTVVCFDKSLGGARVFFFLDDEGAPHASSRKSLSFCRAATGTADNTSSTNSLLINSTA